MSLPLPVKTSSSNLFLWASILLLAGLTSASWAQVIYDTQLFTPLDAMGVRHTTVLPDESIVIAGTESIGNPFPRRKAVVFNHDDQGVLQASYEFQWAGSLHTDLVQATTNTSSGHVSILTISEGDPSRSFGDQVLHLTELDDQLQPIRQVQRSDADSLKYQDFEFLADGSVLATAYSVGPTGSTLGYTTIRFNSQLEVVWRNFKQLTPGSFSSHNLLNATDSTTLVFNNKNEITTLQSSDGIVLNVETLDSELDRGNVLYAEANGISYVMGYDGSARSLKYYRHASGSWQQLQWPSTNALFTQFEINASGVDDLQILLSGYRRVLSFNVINNSPTSPAMKSWRSPSGLEREPFLNASKYLPFTNWQGRQVFVGHHDIRAKPQAGVYTMDQPDEEKILLTLTDTSIVDEAAYAKLIPLAGDSMFVFTYYNDRVTWTHTQMAGYVVSPTGTIVRKDTIKNFPGDRAYLGIEPIEGGFALFHSSRSGFLRDMQVSMFDSRGQIRNTTVLDSLPYSGSYPDKIQLGIDNQLHAFVDPIDGPRVFVIDPSNGDLIRTTMLVDSNGSPADMSPKLFTVLADGGYFVYSGVSDLYRFDATGALIESASIGTSQSSRLPERISYDPVNNKVLLDAPQGRLYIIDLANGIALRTEVSSSNRYLSITGKSDFQNQTPVGSIGIFPATDSLVDHIWYALPDASGQLTPIPNPVELTRAEDLDYLVQGNRLYLLRRTSADLGDALSLVAVALDDSVVNTASAKTNDELLVYPNPINRTVNIELEGKRVSKAMLFDLTGKLVFSDKLDAGSKVQLTFPSLTTGTYSLVIFDAAGEVYTKRLVQQE